MGIDIGEYLGLGTRRDALSLRLELGVTYPLGFTDDVSVVRRYGILGMPTTVFITSRGEVFNTWTGALNFAVLEQQISTLLVLER